MKKLTRKEILKELEQRPLNFDGKEVKRDKSNSSIIHKHKKRTTLLVDVSAVAYQIFFNKCSGVYKAEVSEIMQYSLLEYMLDLCMNFDTPKIILCWDSRHSERNKILPTYKAGRMTYKTPEEIAKIVEMKKSLSDFRRKIVPHLGWNSFQQKGYESDDIIAILTRTLHRTKDTLIIVANDGDLFQLLGTKVHYYSIKMQTLIEPHHHHDKFGYRHNHVIAVKAISGCKSDNIKGVPSIGEVSISKFIQGTDIPCVDKCVEKINQHINHVQINRTLVELPYIGTKLPKVIPFGLNIKGFVKLCERMAHVRLLKKKGFYDKFFNG